VEYIPPRERQRLDEAARASELRRQQVSHAAIVANLVDLIAELKKASYPKSIYVEKYILLENRQARHWQRGLTFEEGGRLFGVTKAVRGWPMLTGRTINTLPDTSKRQSCALITEEPMLSDMGWFEPESPPATVSLHESRFVSLDAEVSKRGREILAWYWQTIATTLELALR
jgi:hypothetical protein